jgi:hypothetical protein
MTTKKRKAPNRRKNNKCYQGHDMTPENTYTYPDGRTDCRKCSRERWRRHYRRNIKSVKEHAP